MAIVERKSTEQRFIVHTDWNGYLRILDTVDARTRVTYDRGTLEIMTLSRKHELVKTILECLVQAILNERRVDYTTGGSMTFSRKDLDRGLEPDASYWIAHCKALAGHTDYDAFVHPPPDLVLEADVTRRSIKRLGIYEAMRVPEVWLYDRRGKLNVHVLNEDGVFDLRDQSATFPWLKMSVVQEHVQKGLRGTTAQAVWAFQDYLRTLQAP